MKFQISNFKFRRADAFTRRGPGVSIRPFKTVSHPFKTVSHPFKTVSHPFKTVSRPFRTVSRPFRTVSRPFATGSCPFGTVRNLKFAVRNSAAFTLIEIAICLAIIGFALVAIIGVLPYGMNTQRDNRQETLVGQDASMLLETIRSGSHGADDLTNYVYAIANTGTGNGYTNTLAGEMGFTPAASFNSITRWYPILTNGANIIGLLSTPEFLNSDGSAGTAQNYSTSNHIIAYVRAMSGLAAEKPPQDNAIMVGDTFAYRLLCVNAPIAVDTNSGAPQGYNLRLADNQRELRLTFQWPLLPNNKADLNNVGYGRQTFRATIGGQLATTNTFFPYLYFYQPQSFNQAP